ncbi:ABC transporter permease [Paenibacillus aceris]|uniref:Aldouronate transport system permease protein n=1 Tax=Paenibacillus aceris TaxID=869555 RepID=A0ABS4HXX3_9BACL|nr:ABC transporter permease subunit [Paenibacillus aceris]MBP1963051.1 putative aldouronate transport system permease protein [Paenibacillus aceris]NHW38465.1 sugar ABC transporter permease [Paenibacillus aceris]
MSANIKKISKTSIVSKFNYDWKCNRFILLMSLPGLIMIALFAYYPMVGIVTAFQNYSLFLGISGSEWIGFDNFIRFFNDPNFFRIIKNTFFLGLVNLLWSFPAPIILALLINEVVHPKIKKFVQTATYLPYFISVVVIVGIMKSIFGSTGIVNDLLANFGVTPIQFFNESGFFRSLYVGSGIWHGVGYSSILYLAAIVGIDTEMYDAAKIDGCSKFKQIIHITLPSIRPTIITLFILSIGGIISVGFDKILLMYSPATYDVADVISTYVYRKGILDQDYGFSSAIGLFNSLVSIVFLLGANYVSRKLLKESLW